MDVPKDCAKRKNSWIDSIIKVPKNAQNQTMSIENIVQRMLKKQQVDNWDMDYACVCIWL